MFLEESLSTLCWRQYGWWALGFLLQRLHYGELLTLGSFDGRRRPISDVVSTTAPRIEEEEEQVQSGNTYFFSSTIGAGVDVDGCSVTGVAGVESAFCFPSLEGLRMLNILVRVL